MATENILMAAVAGRRRPAGPARADPPPQPGRRPRVKQEGQPNDLLERLAADPAFAKVDLAAAARTRSSSSAAPASRSMSSWPKSSSRSASRYSGSADSRSRGQSLIRRSCMPTRSGELLPH